MKPEEYIDLEIFGSKDIGANDNYDKNQGNDSIELMIKPDLRKPKMITLEK